MVKKGLFIISQKKKGGKPACIVENGYKKVLRGTI